MKSVTGTRQARALAGGRAETHKTKPSRTRANPRTILTRLPHYPTTPPIALHPPPHHPHYPISGATKIPPHPRLPVPNRSQVPGPVPAGHVHRSPDWPALVLGLRAWYAPGGRHGPGRCQRGSIHPSPAGLLGPPAPGCRCCGHSCNPRCISVLLLPGLQVRRVGGLGLPRRGAGHCCRPVWGVQRGRCTADPHRAVRAGPVSPHPGSRHPLPPLPALTLEVFKLGTSYDPPTGARSIQQDESPYCSLGAWVLHMWTTFIFL